MIHVVAHVSAAPGKRADLLREFAQVVPLVLKEKGCIEYTPVIDAAGSDGMGAPVGADNFVVVEKWATLEDLRAHMKAPHMAAYRAKVKDLLAKAAIHVLGPA